MRKITLFVLALTGIFSAGTTFGQSEEGGDWLEGMLGNRFEEMEAKRPKSPFEKQHRNSLQEFIPIVAGARESTASVMINKRVVALGTIVSADGFILTKASETGETGEDSVSVNLPDGSTLEAIRVKTFEEYDLLLLKVAATELKPANWVKGSELPVGSLVAASGTLEAPLAIGAISVATRKLSERRQGFLGVRSEEVEGGLQVIDFPPRSPALDAGLMLNDIIVTIDEKPMLTFYDLRNSIGQYEPGDTIQVEILRDGQPMAIEVMLSDRESGIGITGAPGMDHTARMGGGISKNRSGYPLAMENDLMIRPNQCGGPLVNLDGGVVGINIARAGRVKTYTIPSDVVMELLGDLTAVVVPDPSVEEEDVADLSELERAVEEAESEVIEASKTVIEAQERKLEAMKALREAREKGEKE